VSAGDGVQYQQAAIAIRETLDSATRVVAVSHANPDADAVCSLLAIRLAFASPDRSVTIALGPGQIPPNLAFLEGLGLIRPLVEIDASQFDRVIYLDCADEARVDDPSTDFHGTIPAGTPVINIDHHVTNTRFGSIDLIDPDAAATCEILALLFEDMGITLTPVVATALLTGVQGDTLGLRTPSTTSRTLLVSSHLVAAGADLDTIVDQLFRLRPFTTLKLWGAAFSRAELIDGLVWTEVTPDMLRETGASAAEAEGIVNYLAGTMTARVAALLYRERDGWRVSLRSLADDVNVATLASEYGGGGHSRAAGLRLSGDLPERDAFLRDLTKKIRPTVAATHSAE
jgi:bifunctional oligoribonuclease and PAP phosphatase NrnA